MYVKQSIEKYGVLTGRKIYYATKTLFLTHLSAMEVDRASQSTNVPNSSNRTCAPFRDTVLAKKQLPLATNRLSAFIFRGPLKNESWNLVAIATAQPCVLVFAPVTWLCHQTFIWGGGNGEKKQQCHHSFLLRYKLMPFPVWYK